tara:strand:+ start:32 stop:412 length:381 start_codon:yes stop_codon:yes gene_type:complete
MVTFRNNNNSNRRGRFRNHDRNFRRNGDNNKFKSDFTSISNFKRKPLGRNNHNASKLIEKYTDLAREALANEDKIMSENYFQHADHFTRILSEQEKNRANKISNISETNKNLAPAEGKEQVISEKK